MLNNQTATKSGQGSEEVATDPRNGFFNEFQLQWNGSDYLSLLDDCFRLYIVSDVYCEKSENDRIEDIYYFYQMKDMFKKLNVAMRKEVGHA